MKNENINEISQELLNEIHKAYNRGAVIAAGDSQLSFAIVPFFKVEDVTYFLDNCGGYIGQAFTVKKES